MNLVTDPWIPVVTLDGKPDFANLMQVFTEGEKYADLSVRPHERVALMRLLICIAQAALDGPVDKDDWKEAPKKLPDEARMYLTKWNKEEVFELFHKEKPFLQIAGLESNELTPIAKLDLFLASGNMTTLYDHEANGNKNRRFLAKDIAIKLITFQCFSSGGGLPITKWGDIQTKQVGNPDAICLTGGMLHTFLRGNNIFESVCLNLLPKSVVKLHYGVSNTEGNEKEEGIFWGKAIWQLMPKSAKDSDNITNATKTYLGRLLPICRWIKIQPDLSGMHCGKGFDYPVMDSKVQKPKKNQQILPIWPAEPTASVVLNNDKTQRFLKGAKPDKEIWRELTALITKRNQNCIGGPLAFDNPLPTIGFDIHVCALMRVQANIENMVESVYNVSLKIFSQEGQSIYEKEVEEAEWLSRKLGYSIEAYRRNLDNFWDQRVEMAGKDRNKLKAKLYSKATRFYWTAIEKQRHLLMAYIDVYDLNDKYKAAQKAWHDAIHKAARDAYISACGQETPRQIRAFALGWKKLFMEKKPDTVNEDQQNTDGGEE